MCVDWMFITESIIRHGAQIRLYILKPFCVYAAAISKKDLTASESTYFPIQPFVLSGRQTVVPCVTPKNSFW